MILHQPATLWPGSSHGLFRIHRMRRGTGLSHDDGDTGLGPLGTLDRASLSPGLVVPMHEHCDDEILSYLRGGQMYHRDSSGAARRLDATTLMLMNAGRGFSHEEEVPRNLSGTTELLQIFVRPRRDALEPRLQFHAFEQAHARDWRAIAGPENSDAPLKFRNEVWVHDRRVAAGETVTLPRREAWLLWLHLFKGAGRVGDDLQLTRGDSVVIDKPATFMAGETSDLVAFLVDPSAPYSLAGSLSGRA